VSREEVSVSVSEESIEESLPDLSEEPEESEETDLWIDAPTQAAQVDYRSDDRTYTAVLETVEEKEAFFGEYASSALYGGPVKLEDRYDAAYFENHRLLAAYTPVGSGSHRLGTESVWLKNGVLEWTFNEYSTGFGTCDMAGWVLLAEISRDVPVTAETPVELKGYDVNFVQESVGECTEPEALLLEDPESLQAFLSRHCREDFWHDYMGYDIARVDFEKESFIGVYLPLPVHGTVAFFRGLTRTSEGVEVVIGCRIPSEAPDMLGGGCVWLLQVGKDHPAASGEKLTVKAEEEPEIPAELLLEVPIYVEEVQYRYHEEYTAVLGSAEEAKAFFDRYAPAGNGDDYRWQARYDEDFFEEHLLAVAYLPVGSGTPWTGSESLWLKEGVLEWNVNSYVYGDVLEWDVECWVMAAELPRDLPVTEETSIEIHYRGVTLYQVNTAHQGEAEILLLNSREEAEAFMSRYPSEDWEKWDILEYTDFEKYSMIGVYIPTGETDTVIFESIVRTGEVTEVQFGRGILSEEQEAGGKVYLCKVEKEHPALSRELRLAVRENGYVVENWWTVLYPDYQWADIYSFGNTPADVTVLTDLESKQSFFDTYVKSGSFDLQGNPVPVKIEDRYDEAFFEENVLLAVYRKEPSGSYGWKLKEVLIRGGNTLEVFLTRSGQGWTDDMGEWMFFIEIPAEYRVTAEIPVKLTVETDS
ncbi:MAG: hypothetical protein IKV50_00265, partial [Clostridia bacterium]|nr:hypothetical protein [Clostridia bacterium]